MKNYIIKKDVDKAKILDIINKLKFFSEFSSTEKNKLAQYSNYMTIYKKDSCIIKQSEVGSTFHIMLCGKAVVTKDYNNLELYTLKPGDLFGEISFLTNSKRTANVIAIEDCITLEFNKEVLDSLGPVTREKIKDKLLLNLISRINHLNNRLIEVEESLNNRK